MWDTFYVSTCLASISFGRVMWAHEGMDGVVWGYRWLYGPSYCGLDMVTWTSVGLDGFMSY